MRWRLRDPAPELRAQLAAPRIFLRGLREQAQRQALPHPIASARYEFEQRRASRTVGRARDQPEPQSKIIRELTLIPRQPEQLLLDHRHRLRFTTERV